MEKRVKIAHGFSLPAIDLVESAIGIIGKRGKGKTGLVKKLAEELIRVRLPFVWLDPIGIAWGLRSSFDGKGPGLPVLVVGGKHGDVVLDRRAGSQVAKSIIDANVSAVIDFSQESKSAYREFVRDFSHELYKSNNSSRLVILEEAPELVPQRVFGDRAEVFEAVERLVSRGRNNAIGVVLVTQRAATINKDVLSEIDALFVFALASPQDRKAIGEWVEAHGEESKLKTFNDGLAELKKREAWAWSPEAFGSFFKRIYVSDFHTLHPDKTHLRKLGLLESKPVTTDVTSIVTKLGSEMKKLAREKEELQDARKLRLEVETLRKRLQASLDARGAQGALPVDRSKLDALKQENASLRASIASEQKRTFQLTKTLSYLRTSINTIARELEDVALTQASIEIKRDDRTYIPHQERFDRELIEKVKSADKGSLIIADERSQTIDVVPAPIRAGAIRMLEALASRDPEMLSRDQLATLSTQSPRSGTYASYLSRLRTQGLINEARDGKIAITSEGMKLVPDAKQVASTHDDLMKMWRSSLRAGAYKLLEILCDKYPNGVSRADLASYAGVQMTSGTYASYLSKLRRNALVKMNEQHEYVASESLFP